MAFDILVSPIAERNIDDAIRYYKIYSPSAAKNFRKKLFDVFKSLQINPFFTVKYRNVRAVPLKKLPYLVFFEIYEEEQIINIISVFCTHQNPEKYP